MSYKHPSGEAFEGRIGRTVYESEPWWPEPRIPHDKPNVVLIVLDDTGYSHFGCYGSSIETPNIDRLAENGLRYTNFHTTALCSPTRACLLTGRNHHAVGMRGVSNMDTGFPNMRGFLPRSAATLADVLREAGYGTCAAGKWHLTPMSECTASGPFHNWPLQRGFDRFYGFMQGETDQFYPELTSDNHHIDAPAGPDEGYHVSEDIVDRSMGFLRDQVSLVPERPFFLYVAFGATHSPHQAPQEYLDKYRGKFDAGWDVVRRDWFERQKRLGLIPESTGLAPLNPGVRPWDALSENERRFAARLNEAFAAQLDHTDAQIGRLVHFLGEIGRLDDTLLIVMSDNGASQEGGPTGVFDEMRWFNGMTEDVDEAVQRLDDIGGPDSHSNVPWGWSQVGNTPLKWYKQNTHGGGVRDPLVFHWPQGLSDTGSMRRPFCHAIDIMPTVLELTGTEAPAQFRGVEQMPLHGASLAASLASPDASPARSVQYFEMLGHRGIWHDGWKAVTHHERETAFDDDRWELYHLEEDFSETNDLARAASGAPRADDRPVVAGGREARRPAARRPARRPDVPRRAPARTARIAGRLRLLPAGFPYRGGRLSLGGARLDHRGHARAPGVGRGRRAGQSRHAELRIRALHPGRPAALRLQLLPHTHRRRGAVRIGGGGTRGVGRGRAAAGAPRRGTPARRRRAAGGSGDPAAARHAVEHGHGPRPRHGPGQSRLSATVRLSRQDPEGPVRAGGPAHAARQGARRRNAKPGPP